ncbi:MAG: 2-aminobenzoate-CoA ligase [Betaproteobacteria bacterium RIFCSPLOWO2_12_FULL_65_110]|nr:MAG: 2-aminobenzoate-CoA ligase [Betaproteobacteria bacterium RIFCSPLOWO2_12_FULL_65_110]
MNAEPIQQHGAQRIPGGVPSAHADRFICTMMPPREFWPKFDYSSEPLAAYPDFMNAAEVLLDAATAEGYGDKPVFHYEGQTWRYRQLQDYVDKIARVLVEDYGLVPGNRVLMRSANSPMLAACWLAVLKAGGICVTTMSLLKADELIFILNRVRVRFALCEQSLADEMEAAGRSADCLERIAYFTPMGADKPKNADLDRAVEKKTAGFANVRTAADDIALIAFTSGTTGNPKATVHFHRDVIATTDGFARVHTVDRDEVICGSPSMAFTYGLAVLLVFPLRFRATVVIVPRPTPQQILAAVERYRVTSLYGVPTAFNQMLDGLDQFDISSLRKCASSGENLQAPLWKTWREQTGIRLINCYGTTEFVATVLSESLAVDGTGSAGKPVPGYTARIIDSDGQPLPIEAKGRLALRGPTGCRYLDDLEQQQAFVRDGWNITSDIFSQDADGNFWFVDRADDMIISSGHNISPQEVERVLGEHPMVRECAVIGVDDAIRGKLVRACVVLNERGQATQETVTSLQEFVKHRIAPYKYPRDVRFYDELPRTRTGKLQRQRLRSD